MGIPGFDRTKLEIDKVHHNYKIHARQFFMGESAKLSIDLASKICKVLKQYNKEITYIIDEENQGYIKYFINHSGDTTRIDDYISYNENYEEIHLIKDLIYFLLCVYYEKIDIEPLLRDRYVKYKDYEKAMNIIITLGEKIQENKNKAS